MTKKGLVMGLLVGVFLLSCVSSCLGIVETPSSPLFTVTFYDLGYETPVTYHRGGLLTLYVNCSGASLGLYSAKFNLHFTGEDSYYYYQINGGAERSGGANPGCDFFSGWQERSFEPGFFHDGNNTLQIHVYNCPTSDQTSSLNKYLIILPDSYVEIYDASALETESTLLTELVTTVTIFVSSEIVSTPSSDFVGGLVVGALVTGGILVGWYLLSSKGKRVKGYTTPNRRFIARTPTNYVCNICKQNILMDQLTKCPSCQNTFHETHFAEAVKTTGHCPMCKTAIISVDQNGASAYSTWSQETDK